MATDYPMVATPDTSVETHPDRAAFIRANTAVLRAPLVPEIDLHLASEVLPLWRLTEAELAEQGLPPPYWAFAWAGGQALARFVLDHPASVAGKRVLDFATGSGLVAIAAMRAGALRADAIDVDRFATDAARLNAALNGVALTIATGDPIGAADGGWQTVLAGDIFYERRLAEAAVAWLRRLAGSGTTVLLGDPGRTYLPRTGVEQLARYAVPTSRELEDNDVRSTGVWRLLPQA